MANKKPHGKITDKLPRGTARIVSKKLHLKDITFEDFIVLKDALVKFKLKNKKQWEQDCCTACTKYH